MKKLARKLEKDEKLLFHGKKVKSGDYIFSPLIPEIDKNSMHETRGDTVLSTGYHSDTHTDDTFDQNR
jgi:hypothetical protein